MDLTINIDSLSIDQQQKLYIWLKAKFEPDSPVALAEPDFKREVILNKSVKELGLTNRVCSRLLSVPINTVRELCQRKRSDLMKIINLGVRGCDEIEAVLAKLDLSLQEEQAHF